MRKNQYLFVPLLIAMFPISSAFAFSMDLYGNSTMTVTFPSVYVNTHMTSTLNVAGSGTVTALNAFDQSNVNVSGGSISYLTAGDSSNIDITGGDISWLYAKGSSSFDISSGNISWLYSYDTAELNISGGDFSWINANGGSVIDITYLDSVSGLYATDNSEVHLYGSDFLYEDGLLSGAWGNGDEFSFITSSYAGQLVPADGLLPENIILHSAPAPEPTTMLLFATGLLGLTGFSRRKKK